jgi:hypothetical protein
MSRWFLGFVAPRELLEGGQVILAWRVLWLSGFWDASHQRYLASKPVPVIQA